MKKDSKQIKEVLAVLKELTPIFFLQGWDLTVSLVDSPNEDNENVAAQIHPLNKYRSADLTVFPRFFQETPEERRRILVHELCHIPAGIQNGLIQVAKNGRQIGDHETDYAFEEETSWFEKIIYRLL